MKIIEKAEKGCSARLFQDPMLWLVQKEADSHPLVGLLSKAELRGARILFKVGFGGKRPSSYNGTPESTHVIFQHKGGAWKIVEARRGIAPTNNTFEFILSESQKERAIEKALKNVCIN